MSMKRRYLALCISAALSPALAAENVDTSDWVCEFCPFEEGTSGDYDVGATNVSDDSAYFGNATGYDEEGAYANLDARGGYASEQHRVRWNVEDLGLSSRVINVDGGKPGRFSYNLDWSELPYRQFYTTETVFADAGNASLTLPSDWVRAPTTAGFTALDSNLVNRTLESDRQNLGLGGRYDISRRWSINADYRQRNNDGVRMFGGPTYTNASQLPAPFDYTTDEVELGVRYGTPTAFVGLSWYLSDFDNKYDSLSWQQPFTTDPGAENPEMAQAPDNRFQQLRLNGGYVFSEWRTVVNLTAAFGQIEQDAAYLAYTTNPNLSPDPLPRANLDGEVDTSNITLSVNSRPLQNVRLRASYRYDERDNKTDRDAYSRVIADTFLSGEQELNSPFSYERHKFVAVGDWDPLTSLRLSAGVEWKDYDRTLQEDTGQDEFLSYGRVLARPAQSFEFDLRYGNSRRDIDNYDTDLALVNGQNPLMRKYNLAYRFREFVDLRASWSPGNLPISLSLRGLIAEDSYSRSELGLRNGDEESWSADFSWYMTPNASLFINGGVDDLEWEQFGSAAFDEADWRGTNDDSFTSWGGGFNINNIAEKFDIRFSALSSRGESKISILSLFTGADQFPDLETDLDRVRLELLYRSSEKLEWTFSANYQSFEASDWALQGVDPDTVPQLFALGANPYDEDNVLIGIGVRYRLTPN